MHKSVYDNQEEILKSIYDLYIPDGFDCDVTYGNGVFYKNLKPPMLRYDIDPVLPDVVASCSTSLPLDDGCIKSLMFDPPFLTYIKNGREHESIMAKRFSGYWRYDELENHYKKTAVEAARVLKKGGYFVIKCQDIIHNHRMHPTHIFMHGWAADAGFRLEDIFVLTAKHRMPANKGKQKHARIHHSYFMVFKKIGVPSVSG